MCVFLLCTLFHSNGQPKESGNCPSDRGLSHPLLGQSPSSHRQVSDELHFCWWAHQGNRSGEGQEHYHPARTEARHEVHHPYLGIRALGSKQSKKASTGTLTGHVGRRERKWGGSCASAQAGTWNNPKTMSEMQTVGFFQYFTNWRIPKQHLGRDPQAAVPAPLGSVPFFKSSHTCRLPPHCDLICVFSWSLSFDLLASKAQS